MHGNQVLLNIKNEGSEKGVVRNLLQLAEEIEDLKRTIKEIAKTITTLTQVVTLWNTAGDEMKSRLEKFEPKDDDAQPTREGL